MLKEQLLRAVGLAVLVFPMSQVARADSVCGAWENMSTPNPAAAGNVLQSVAATTAGEAWAVGYMQKSDTVRLPLVLRSGIAVDGWQEEPLPSEGAVLNDVAVVPGGDVWVVGGETDEASAQRPYAVRWRHGAWDQPGASAEGAATGSFNGVAAFADDDVWMVGEAATAQARGTISTSPLLSHWDGQSLSHVALPFLAGSLRAVAGTGPKDVWVVGDARDKAGSHAVTYHFDGTEWSVVPNPAEALAGSSLHDVVALASDDVWAVGEAGAPNTLAFVEDSALYLHWNGKLWERITVPGGPGVRAIAGLAGDDLWAAGPGAYSHWDGKSWSVVAAAGEAAARRGIAVLGPCDVISVGAQTGDGGTALTLAERLQPAGTTPTPQEEAPATPGSAQVPGPQELTLATETLSAEAILLEWTAPQAGADAILIERCAGALEMCSLVQEREYVPVAKLAADATRHQDMGLQASTAYTYRVRAIMKDETLVTSNAASATTWDGPSPDDEVVVTKGAWGR